MEWITEQTRSKRGPQDFNHCVPSNLRKASSTFNIFDDLRRFLVLLQHLHSSKKFEGEPEERRRARLERERRTQERAAKALEEKNQQDLIGGTLDAEVMRWAAGKEGNLRALQSSIQYQRQSESGETAAALVSFSGESAAFFPDRFTLCNTLNNLKINLEHFAIEAKMKDEDPFGL
nr:auxilin-related protein 2-like [Tanacetum cinerariifolium]